MIQIGDIVSRYSYQNDILFRVISINTQGIALLLGIDIRLIADGPISDLKLETETTVSAYMSASRRRGEEKLYSPKKTYRRDPTRKEDPGFIKMSKILHLDGDSNYLKVCMENYEKLGLPAVGFYVPEKNQPRMVQSLIKKYSPDILVLTGHDNMNKKSSNLSNPINYSHSYYYIEAVKEARRIIPSMDDLVIFAGACQSNFEALMEAGANFASSPYRVFIHTLDPLLVVEEIAYTPASEMVSLMDVISGTVTGIRGIGGIETKGKLRRGIPQSPFVEERSTIKRESNS